MAMSAIQCMGCEDYDNALVLFKKATIQVREAKRRVDLQA